MNIQKKSVDILVKYCFTRHYGSDKRFRLLNHIVRKFVRRKEVQRRQKD